MTAKRDYQRCTRTIMDTTDPDIWFDDDGVSSHAIDFDRHMAERVRRAQSGQALGELHLLVEAVKDAGRDRRYDCVIGVSGGVDSTYLLLQAVRLGLRPLAVHFDSGWNSDLATANINNLVTTLGVDLHRHVGNPDDMRDLQLAFFRASVANCDIPTDHAFAWVAFQQASKHGVKHILSGHNLQSESILPKAWGYNAADARHVRGIHKKFGTRPLTDYPLMGLVKRHIWFPYFRGIRTLHPLNLLPYVHADVKREITREVGWQDYGGKHYESVFTRYFQGAYLPQKFGYDKRLPHYSSLILSGQMTRDEALSALEADGYPADLQEQDAAFIAEKLGVTSAEFEELISLPPVDYSAYPNNEKLWDAAAKTSRIARSILRQGR